MTHVLEGTGLYQEFSNLIEQYARDTGVYDARLKTAWKLYKNKKGYTGVEGFKAIKKEVIADLAGDYLFQDAEFVKRLTTNRKLYQKVWDEIKYLSSIVQAGTEEEKKLLKAMKAFENAYNADTKARAKAKVDTKADGEVTTQFALEYAGDTPYVRTERNSFVKEDGTPMTEREVFNSLVDKTIPLQDGEVWVVKTLPKKDMYNELFTRRPKKLGGVEQADIKRLNSEINYNIRELLENSTMQTPNEPDYNEKHKEQGITSFDERAVMFYDGEKAYKITFSVGKLTNGKKVAYAKRFVGYNEELTKKIQATETTRYKNTGVNQQPVLDPIIAEDGKKVNDESLNFSISADSNGKTLTEGQRNYFKNSKVVDENGNLKVMYHGTSNGGFTVFDTYGSNYGLF